MFSKDLCAFHVRRRTFAMCWMFVPRIPATFAHTGKPVDVSVRLKNGFALHLAQQYSALEVSHNSALTSDSLTRTNLSYQRE